MPYADIEKRREMSRLHYSRNKSAYNPGREVARAAFRPARQEIIELSNQRWVPPWRVKAICEDHVHRQYDHHEYHSDEHSAGIYELALKWCLRGTVGWLEGGVFLGHSPFLIPNDSDLGNKWARDEFLKHAKPPMNDSARVELMILNLTLKRIKLYGR
jgi:hypothetical protein